MFLFQNVLLPKERSPSYLHSLEYGFRRTPPSRGVLASLNLPGPFHATVPVPEMRPPDRLGLRSLSLTSAMGAERFADFGSGIGLGNIAPQYFLNSLVTDHNKCVW